MIRLTQLSAVAQLSVPIYQGGGEYSAVRQSKETLGQQRLNLDINRDQARATVVQSWGQLDAAKAQIESTTAQVNSAEIALNGVREEARVGQRTTLDVLNAQQELVNARVALVTANPRKRPSRMYGSIWVKAEKKTCTSPPKSPTSAGPPPR